MAILYSSLFVALAVVFGTILGLNLRPTFSSEDVRRVLLIQFGGRILMNMLSFMTLPLTVTCIITTITSIGYYYSGKVITVTGLYYVMTSLFASVMGIALALLIRPGRATGDRQIGSNNILLSAVDQPEQLTELIRQCFPNNIVTSSFQTVSTQFVKPDCETGKNSTIQRQSTASSNCSWMLPVAQDIIDYRTNFIGVIVASIVLGSTINHLHNDGRPMRMFFNSLNAVTIRLMRAVIWYTPIGLLSLLTYRLVSLEEPMETIAAIGRFVQVIIVGLAIHGAFTLPFVYFLFSRRNPMILAIRSSRTIFTALVTASSPATLTVTIDSLLESGINRNIAYLVAPLGSAFNKDASALYHTVVCIFVAQRNNLAFSLNKSIMLSLSLIVAILCLPAKPQMTVATVAIILSSVGLPLESIYYMLSVEWLLQPIRTVISVWGDCICAGVMDYYYSDVLPEGVQPFTDSDTTTPRTSIDRSISDDSSSGIIAEDEQIEIYNEGEKTSNKDVEKAEEENDTMIIDADNEPEFEFEF